MQKMIYFQAVQVVSRLQDGELNEWWPGDQVASLREAKANAVRLRKEHPNAEYEVVRTTIDVMATGQKGSAA